MMVVAQSKEDEAKVEAIIVPFLYVREFKRIRLPLTGFLKYEINTTPEKEDELIKRLGPLYAPKRY